MLLGYAQGAVHRQIRLHCRLCRRICTFKGQNVHRANMQIKHYSCTRTMLSYPGGDSLPVIVAWNRGCLCQSC